MATKKKLHQTFDEVQEILDRALVKPDWSENNGGSDAYVVNRTHWVESGALTSVSLSWDGDTLTRDMVFTLSGVMEGGGTEWYTLPNTVWDDGTILPNGEWAAEIAGHVWTVWVSYTSMTVIMDVTSVYDNPRWRGHNGLIITPSPISLSVEIPYEYVHKLDNKYIDIDASPMPGSPRPVSSGGVYTELGDVVFIGDEIGSAVPPGVDFNAFTDTVWNKEQTLSQAQKDQVKENLGITCDENLSNLEIIDLLGI